MRNSTPSSADLSGAFDDVVHAVDVALGHVSAAGVDRQAAAGLDRPAGHERTALALGAEAVVLDLQQDGDREAVVQLGDVDVGGPEAGAAVQRLGDGLGRQRGDVVAQHDGELDPRLRVDQRARGRGADEHRWVRRVTSAFGAGDDDGGGAVGLQAEVVEPQRAGDPPRREVVVHRQRTAVHLRMGVLVGPVAAGDGDRPEVLLVRAVLVHVPLGDEGEDLPGREQAVGEEQLVVGSAATDAGRGDRAEPEAPAAAPVERAVAQHVRGHPRHDGSDGLGDHRRRGNPAGTGIAVVVEVGHPECVDEVVVAHRVHVAADDPVDVLWRQAGVGDRGERRLRRQRQHAATRVAAEIRGTDAADRAAIPVMERLVIPHRGLRPVRPGQGLPTAPPLAYADPRMVRLTLGTASTPHEKFAAIPPDDPTWSSG
jgi:hypothetical protein